MFFCRFRQACTNLLCQFLPSSPNQPFSSGSYLSFLCHIWSAIKMLYVKCVPKDYDKSVDESPLESRDGTNDNVLRMGEDDDSCSSSVSSMPINNFVGGDENNNNEKSYADKSQMSQATTVKVIKIIKTPVLNLQLQLSAESNIKPIEKCSVSSSSSSSSPLLLMTPPFFQKKAQRRS